VGSDAAALVAAHNAARAEQLAALAALGDGVLNQEEAGICAEVRIRIDQEAVLTRTAFQGTFEITNGNTGVPLTGVQLTLDIRDEAGNSVNDLFAMRDPVLAGLTGIDGTGVLAGGASGRAQYLFMPTVDAARTQAARYTIGGTLSYLEGGQKITVPLMPAQITVFPEAQLNLHYFQQRDVIGDDPFTKDVVEASDPFALGLLVYNDGAGDARNMSITSAQPKIIENEKGLLIDFKIIGTQVGTQSVAPTLTANLGNIAAGKTQVAQWMLTSSLQGKFTEFSASFEHLDGMGDQRLSLIKSVNVHELIRSVKANGGDAPDFLANDDPDAEHAPDRLYMNDGSQHVVRSIANATASHTAAPGKLAVTLSAEARTGWGYLKIADPGVGYVLDRIVRSDGKVLELGREVWRTDRSFPESIPGAVRENLLHFIDENSTGLYTVYYKIDDAVAPRLVEIVAVSPDPAAGPIASIDVRFSEQLDPASFTVADLHLAREGESANLLANAQDVTITALGNGAYRIGGLESFTATSGLYRLTVNATGVKDYAGNVGTGVLTETWGVGQVGPYVLSMASGPAARNSALDTVDLTFNTALDVTSFSAEDLRLERDGVLVPLAGTNLSLTPLAGNQYRLSGLAALTALGGNYTLTLSGSGLLSSSGAAGLGSHSVGWRMDTVAPTVLDLADLVDRMRKIVLPSIEVTLSEQVDLASFDYRDIVLTRTWNGVTSANLIDAQTKVEHVSGNVYRISGFNWVSGQQGAYSLRVDGAGIKDAAGNSGAGSASEAWTMDLTDPLAATNLAVSPDSGAAANDGLLKSLNFTLSGALGEPGLSVRVTDQTSGKDIGYATVDGSAFSIPVKLDMGGRHVLRVRSVDAAGNLADSTVVVFVDLVAPTLEAPVLARDAAGNVERITLNFSEALDPSSVTLEAFSLVRDGGANLLNGATLTRVSPTQYVLGNLAGITAPAGSYKLAVDMTRVRDMAGNAGVGNREARFDGALASTGSIAGVVYDDIDGTGTREADELVQGGWTVFDDLDADGVLDAGEVSAVTDAAGRYALQGLALGEHRIVVVTPNGWTITPGAVAQVTLDAAAPTVTRNFGAYALASMSGTVFDDANANGVRDAGEAALAGRQVLFDLNNNGVADAGETSVVTDSAGHYLLANLRPGSGRVVLFAGEGYVALQPSSVYAPKSGEAALRNLAAVKPGAIGGMKYEDMNGNGQRDAGELGVAGWKVFLDDNGNDALDVGERYTFTDANGLYAFNGLAPGSYRVVEEVRAGWIQTAPGSIEAGDGQQTLDVQLTLPGMVADMEQEYLIQYLDSTGANFDCGCGTFVLEKYTTGQAASHFTKLNTITDSALQGLTGRGVRVAVIDTGINVGSSFFGPDANGDGVADRIAFQYDFGDNDGDASDTMGHGTNVAGVIAGADAQYGGVATEADLVVLKVFDSNNAGFLSTLRKSLEWLDANAEKYGIGVVNMSLGDGGNWGDAISRYGMGDLFQRLAAKGLVMVAASGNNYAQTGGGLGVAYPGADPAVLSVGAMWAGNFGGPWRFSNGATDYTTAYGRIASFTQRDPDQIDVMAPGARFTSAGLNGGLSTMQGTSQAAAFMSGTAALVQQAAKQLMGRYLNTGEFAALLDVYTYRAVDGDDESDNVLNSGASYNKLDIPRLLKGLKAYAATGQLPGGGVPGGPEQPGDSPLTAYSPRTAQVLPGQTLPGQDFGNFRLGQVGGRVFADTNGDGAQGAGEAGLAGITMYIDADSDGVLDAGETRTTTNAEGQFSFGTLGPGAIDIRAVVPDGQQTSGPAVRKVSVTSGLDISSLRFGFGAPAAAQALDDSATVNEDASVTIDVLANDLGQGSGPVLAIDGAGPAHGSAQVVNGQFVYTPAANFAGSDSFRYKVTRADGSSSIATVSVTVAPVNDTPLLAPVADGSIAEGQTLVLQLAGSDVDGDTLAYSLVSGPAGATVDPVTGAVRWSATAADTAQAFKVQVSDGKGGLAERSFSIDVQPGKLVTTAFAAHAWGFAIRFNDVLDQSRFNLYGANPDLEVKGAKAGVVAGSV
ncbi:MAG: SdrD B-like domain-containing protein, partial [Telluria sp.]